MFAERKVIVETEQRMSRQTIINHFGNGVTVLFEPMQNVQSVAFTMMFPAGSSYDPAGLGGTSAILSEMIGRGAGAYDHRELSLLLDQLGLQRQESSGVHHLTFSGATLGRNLQKVLEIYGEIIKAPHLPEEDLEGVISGAEQGLKAQEDDPRQRLMVELRKQAFSPPCNRPVDGTINEIRAIDINTIKSFYEQRVTPDGMIMGFAGNFQVETLESQLEGLLGSWFKESKARPPAVPKDQQIKHIKHDSAQTHIGISYPSVTYEDPDYFKAWAAVSILSGGMSSRLFTQVREERGLCYSIGASLYTLKDEAQVLCYAGTTNERAQETLDVTLRVLSELKSGIKEEELNRCKAIAKSSLIMQQESTISRSSKVARDYFFLGRVQGMQEIRERVESLTVEQILDYLQRQEEPVYNIVTLGPEALEQTRAI